jgi:lipoate-protein ligase A
MPVSSGYALAEWRFLSSGYNNGPTNMAIDEAILEAIAKGNSPPTLRVYGWEPACLSLGFRQSYDIVNVDFCRDAGWEIVRRPTGGRAILHIDELTYSVCAPAVEPRVRGSVLESYQRLSKALLAGLNLMGLSPARAEPDPQSDSKDSPACFDEPSDYEITIDGRKLIGSAQMRKKGAVLQHGSIPLSGDLARIVTALHFDGLEDQQALVEHLGRNAITLESALGQKNTFKATSGRLVQGFAQTLNLDLRQGDLTEEEKSAVRRLLATKYANDDWTKRL